MNAGRALVVAVALGIAASGCTLTLGSEPTDPGLTEEDAADRATAVSNPIETTTSTTMAPEALKACKDDTLRLKQAIYLWHVRFLEGTNPAAYASPYPPSQDLMLGDGNVLAERSELHVLSGDGNAPPFIDKADGECEGERINQLTG